MIELADHVGVIEITGVPSGEAPEEIRRAWIGIQMSCLFYKENDHDSRGVLTGNPVVPAKVYVVPQEEAISALEKVRPEAGQWWRDNGFPSWDGALFAFQADSVTEVTTVLTRQQFEELLERLSLKEEGG